MKTLLLFKELYTDAFRGIGGNPQTLILKSMSWLCFLCISVAFYAFIYRAVTGFRF
ncbi:DUF6747 family protein [Ascidiimonas sp. W6]|uniref:DUF6747 family protein n=1 Tax=Ascidiimonas meishanensis TaxID=3128903 RepID=UPI0030ECC502